MVKLEQLTDDHIDAITKKVPQISLKGDLNSVTKLDLIFEDVKSLLDSLVKEDKDALQKLLSKPGTYYQSLEGTGWRRGELIGLIIHYIKGIEAASIERKEELKRQYEDQLRSLKTQAGSAKASTVPPPDLIPISLYDLKLLQRLLNVIIIYGFAFCLPAGVGLPFEKRISRTDALLKLKYVTDDSGLSGIDIQREKRNLLKFLVNNFLEIIRKPTDLSIFISNGPCLSDIFAATAELASNDSNGDISDTAEYDKVFDQLVESIEDTYQLFSVFTALLASHSNTPAYFLSYLSQKLSMVPIMRPNNGVESLLDFTLGLREGSDVNVDMLNRALRILKSVPKTLSGKEYFTEILRQLFEILGSSKYIMNRPTLVSSAAFIVSSFYEGNPVIVKDLFLPYIFENLDPSWCLKRRYGSSFGTEEEAKSLDGVVILTDTQINKGTNAILTLLKRASPEFSTMLMSNSVCLTLWGMMCFCKRTKKPRYDVLFGLFVSYFTITNNVPQMKEIISRLTYNGTYPWSYHTSSSGDLEIRYGEPELSIFNDEKDSKESPDNVGSAFGPMLEDIDMRVEIVSLLMDKLQPDMTSEVFSFLLNAWVAHTDMVPNPKAFSELPEPNRPVELPSDVSILKTSKPLGSELNVHTSLDTDSEMANEDVLKHFVQLKLLHTLMEKNRDKITKFPSKILQLITMIIVKFREDIDDMRKKLVLKRRSEKKALGRPLIQDLSAETDTAPNDKNNIGSSDDLSLEMQFEEQDENIEMINTLLHLLSAVITENSNHKLDSISMSLLRGLPDTLGFIGTFGPQSLRDYCLALSTRLQLFTENKETLPKDAQAEEKLERALLNISDPLVPIRAHGLVMLRELILEKSSVIDVNTAVAIYLDQMKDNDSFIYLNCIKGLETLVDIHREKVLPSLLRRYRDEVTPLEQRLRVGEVISRVVLRLGKAFVDQTAFDITITLLELIKRKDKNKVDNNLRISAMSILGTVCKTNPKGVFPLISDALDCANGILTLEKKQEDVGLRRAAVVLVASLVTGLSSLSEFPKEHIKTTIRNLRYVGETDRDTLVRVQCEQTLELIGQSLKITLTSH